MLVWVLCKAMLAVLFLCSFFEKVYKVMLYFFIFDGGGGGGCEGGGGVIKSRSPVAGVSGLGAEGLPGVWGGW